MENWYTLEECNTGENTQLWNMYRGSSVDRQIAIEISENPEIEVSYRMYTSRDTIKLLEDCSEYFKYLGVHISTPNMRLPPGRQHVVVGELKDGLKKTRKKHAPHIFWRSVKENSGYKGKCGHIWRETDGFYKSSTTTLSEGLYRCEKGIWKKRIIWKTG